MVKECYLCRHRYYSDDGAIVCIIIWITTSTTKSKLIIADDVYIHTFIASVFITPFILINLGVSPKDILLELLRDDVL